MKSLRELYAEHQGKVSDKWSIYLAEYDRLFSSFRKQSVRMLEIGIQNGGSLEIWSKYFSNAQILIGCDINSDCATLDFHDPRIQLVIGDANTDAVENKILSHSTNFDLIIDDGSHTSSDIAKSFARYFRHLNEGGLFIAEDLHCSYWSEFEGGLYYPYSSMAFFKRLADVINHEHWGIPKERRQLLRGFSEKFSIEFDERELADIHSIEFFNSVCVVRKLQAGSNELGERFIAGQQELVVPGLDSLSGRSQALSQGSNHWATMTSAPEETWQQLTDELSNRDSQIAILNRVVSERDGQIEALEQSLSERDGQILALYNSNSWRITRPLRAIVQQMKRIRRIAKQIKPAIKRHGGLKITARKAMQLYRREGLGGIKRGLNAVKISVQVSPEKNSGKYDRNDYTEWVRRYDTVTEETRATMQASIDNLNAKPLISVVMPTYNSRQVWLIEAIESVRRQIYTNWELCIADDASTDKAIRPILERYAKEDSRIKVVFREQNGHISASSNSALQLVTGEWVALLDHDDLLSEHALFWVAEAINQEPDARLIYSDEDKIDEDGNRHGPYFKCDWNIDLFYSQNMFSHLGVYHIDILQKIGGFREGLEGAQDYDLALRCIEQIDAKQICHIPRVLYHWRVHAESTAQSKDVKPYAMLAGERALNEHFIRKKINATSEFVGSGYRTHYALPDSLPMVSLIIPTRNGLQLLRQCVESILKKTVYPNYEILIIDNGSDELETIQYLEEVQADVRVRVVRDDRPFNYSALNNSAVKSARGEVLGLLNNDLEVISPEWLSEMVSIALQPGVGAVGARLWYPDDTLQHGGVILGIGGVAGHSHKYLQRNQYGYISRAYVAQSLSAVTAACLVVKKSVYAEVEGLNEVDLAVAFNDVDFCLRVREAGYRNVWTPYAELYHHESATRGLEDTLEKQARFVSEVEYMRRTWGDTLLNDPAYSPNLTLDHEDFSLAWPPRIVK